MSLLAVNCFLSLLVLALLALFLSVRRERLSRKMLEDCSDLLQEIFKRVDESSAMTRILAQETPKQELKRLKYLLEKRRRVAEHEKNALRRVLNGLPDGVIALDSSRNVVFCNLAYCDLMSIPEETHEGKKCFEILRHHVALTESEKFLNQSEVDFSETEFLTNGQKTLKMRMIRIKEETTTLDVFVFSDISKLKKLEVMRRDFVANVSHELRTPLTSIHGFIETLLDGAGAETATRERFLGLMKTDSERLRRLIEDLLALSRIESGASDFEKQTIHVSVEADEILELFALRIHQKRLALNKQINQDLVVSANRDQFRQVLVNLLDNAVKFTPDGGLVSIMVTVLKNGQVEIRVADSGVGVSSDNREKIFQRFFREDKARSRETGGTGLGLAIVKHIMEAHRGQVRCEENPSGGSIFIITFPE